MNRHELQSFAVRTDSHQDLLPSPAADHFAFESSFPVVQRVALGPTSPQLRLQRVIGTPNVHTTKDAFRPNANDLSVALQLVEAARKARQGDREGTSTHIARAVALLRGEVSPGSSAHHSPSSADSRIARGGLPAWQTRRVFTYVDANLGRRISIRELAQLVDLSPSYFCRAFKCSSGVAPREYVLRRRVEVAQKLMLTTSEPLSAIAASCGMCDQSHLTRSFQKMVGETPYSWRRARLGAPTL
jgi:AraC family transcriptional regulator